MNLIQPSLVLASTLEMGFVKGMVGNHEAHMRGMYCDMAHLKIELVELQNLREGFKHFITEHWLPLSYPASVLVSEAYPSATN